MDNARCSKAVRLIVIVDMLQGRGYTVGELAEWFGVSQDSICRDLKLLHTDGLCGMRAQSDGGRWVVTTGGQDGAKQANG